MFYCLSYMVFFKLYYDQVGVCILYMYKYCYIRIVFVFKLLI